MEYMPNAQDGNHKATREAFFYEDSEYSDEDPMSGYKNVKLTSEQFVQIRRWVLFRRDIDGLADYYRNYCDTLTSNSRANGKGFTVNEVHRQTNFIHWLYNKLLEENKTESELWRYVEGLVGGAKEYKKYRVNG